MWHLSDFLTGNVSLSDYSFTNFCPTHRSVFEMSNAISLYEALLVREGWLTVENFRRSELMQLLLLCLDDSLYYFIAI
jgi:hypothetical protein